MEGAFKMEPIKIGVWGFGAMGRGMVDMLLRKKGVEVVSVVDIYPEIVGKSIFDLLDRRELQGAHQDVFIESDYEKAFGEGAADLVLLATDSYTKNAFSKIEFLLENKIHVISTAEEMAYPQAQEPELAKEMDKIAKANNVCVLGTGINPGFVLDLLVLALTGTCEEVDSIKAARVNDLSPFGPAVMEGQGVGTTVKDFQEGVKNGTIAGHVGFPETIAMVAEGIGWQLDEVKETREPIITSVDRETKYAKVKAGDVAGCRQMGYGIIDGETRITMEHPQQILPELEGQDTGDYIQITGTPNIQMEIKPEIPGGIGTIAMCVNMIPHVINAKPGLRTMLDLPVPRAIMGDMRELIL